MRFFLAIVLLCEVLSVTPNPLLSGLFNGIFRGHDTSNATHDASLDGQQYAEGKNGREVMDIIKSSDGSDGIEKAVKISERSYTEANTSKKQEREHDDRKMAEGTDGRKDLVNKSESDGSTYKTENSKSEGNAENDHTNDFFMHFPGRPVVKKFGNIVGDVMGMGHSQNNGENKPLLSEMYQHLHKDLVSENDSHSPDGERKGDEAKDRQKAGPLALSIDLLENFFTTKQDKLDEETEPEVFSEKHKKHRNKGDADPTDEPSEAGETRFKEFLNKNDVVASALKKMVNFRNGNEKDGLAVLSNTTEKNALAVIEKELLALNSEDFKAREVCYENVGCFSTGAPWRTPQRPCLVPEHPEKLGTQIWLHNNRSKIVYSHPTIDFNGVNFQHNHETYFLIHGLYSSGQASWVRTVGNILTKGHANVLVVDWSKVAKPEKALTMLVACGDARVVAREAAAIVRFLYKKKMLRTGKTHCIGHGFGAHICGLMGKNLTAADLKMVSITALDASQHLYEDTPASVRLSKIDAKMVVAHHTSSSPFGAGYMGTNIAHIHFYYNGGMRQPGCPLEQLTEVFKDITKTMLSTVLLGKPMKRLENISLPVENFVLCSHNRVTDYFIEAISSECHMGYPMTPRNFAEGTLNALTEGWFIREFGSSVNCSDTDECLTAGLDMSEYPSNGIYEVLTRNHAPYCFDYRLMRTPDEKHEFQLDMFEEILEIYKKMIMYVAE